MPRILTETVNLAPAKAMDRVAEPWRWETDVKH